MKGFVFLEPDVTFKLSPGGRIVLESGVHIKKGAIFECGPTGNIHIKEGATIGHYAFVGSTHRIEIGIKSHIGHCAIVIDVNHNISADSLVSDQGYAPGETVIGDDCIIGAKATVSANVKIGRGAIVAANSVVLIDLPDYHIAGGVPAKIIKERT